MSLGEQYSWIGDFEHKSFIATSILFLSCLWSIKLSFLILFRRLGKKVRGHRILWRWALGSTVVAWVVCIGVDSLKYRCCIETPGKLEDDAYFTIVSSLIS